MKLAELVDLVVGDAVDRAARCEYEPVDAERLRHVLGHAGGHDVGVAREIDVDGAGRVADEPRQVNHRRCVAHHRRHARDVGDVALYDLEVRVSQESGDRLAPVH